MQENNSVRDKKITRAKIVIDALRKHYGLSVGKFAEMLGVGSSTVSTWALRDSLDEDLIFRKCEGVSYDFLKTGKGAMFDRELKDIAEGKKKADHTLIVEAIIGKVVSLSEVEQGEAYALLSKHFTGDRKVE